MHEAGLAQRSLGVDLTGRRALVTGGTRGIGAAAAAALAAAGAAVVVSARTASVESPFPVVVADASDPESTSRLAAEAQRLLGGVDLLVSNVGGQVRRPSVLDFSDSDWQTEIETNLLSAVRLDRALIPAMVQRRRGAVVHVSSGAARINRPGSAAYSASKAALNAYSKALANEVGAAGIRVNTLSPGFISTSRIAELATEQARSAEDVEQAIVTGLSIPLARAGTGDEVAQAIVFLLSDAAAYITGTNITVDGGAFPVS